MSDEEDDYLSDKFLVDTNAASSQPKTYAQRRQEALKQSRIRNEQNRNKSRRQREQESREEGLGKSLFERAEEDGGENKALGMMMKMGFKMGQSLGNTDDDLSKDVERPSPVETSAAAPSTKTQHKVEPLPLSEWTGKKGIGLGKRARSPGVSDRIAKMAKMAEETSQTNFRDRSRREYEERRAETRLAPAQRTCLTLDEKAGISFNTLCLDPKSVDTIPQSLMDAISDYTRPVPSPVPGGTDDEASRLRSQMRADALQPVGSDDDDEALIDTKASQTQQDEFPPETVEEAAHFLRLGPRDRLSLLLTYLRDKYAYCFWCGTQFQDEGDMAQSCPGPEEDDHD